VNIAYEKRYQDWRAQYDTLFAPENRFPQQDGQFLLADGRCTMSRPASTRQRDREPRKCSSGPAPTMILTPTCWLSPAASGSAPTLPSYWTFPALSNPSPLSVDWICGALLTRTIPGLMILNLSAGRKVG